MDETPALSAPQRDEAAARLLQEAKGRGRLPGLRPLLRNAPLLLRRHGLGQTLAYLQSRGAGRADSPYQMLYQHLGSWLCELLAQPPGDALAALTRADSRLYLLASEEAAAFVLALRRALTSEEANGYDEANPPQEAN